MPQNLAFHAHFSNKERFFINYWHIALKKRNTTIAPYFVV